jgi:outer membrane receptor protein involved in Fe transport
VWAQDAEDDYESDQVDIDVFVELDVEDEFALLEEELAADEVESASKHRQSIFWSPSAVTVFTREDIRYAGVTRLADLLRRVPGFDVYQMKDSWPLVGARSLTDESNNLVLVLVDGRETLVEFAGFAIWTGMAFDLEEIERIEVIRGPGSTLYGANAFAAIINITTVAEKPQSAADVFIKGGEVGAYRLFGRVRNGWDLGDGRLSFSAGLGAWEKRSVSDLSDLVLDVNFRFHGYLRYQQRQDLDLALHVGIALGNGVFYVHMGDMRIVDATTIWAMGKAAFALGEKVRLKAQFYYVRFRTNFDYRSEFYAYDIWVADIPNILADLGHASAAGPGDPGIPDAYCRRQRALLPHYKGEDAHYRRRRAAPGRLRPPAVDPF